MKVVVTDGRGALTIADIPQPRLGEYDCLVRIEACAFCSSTDRHIIQGTFPYPLQYPAVLGHETVGTVVKVGPRVRHFQPGDRVLRAYAVYPDEQSAGYYSAWGGFAEYGKITDSQAMDPPGTQLTYQQKLPDAVSLATAVMMIPAKEIWSAVQKISPITQQRFLVTGAGVTALLFGRFLRLLHAGHVTLVARRSKPLQCAKIFGAADDVYLFDDLPLQPDYDALIDTTGSGAAVMAIAPAVKAGGHFYAYAIYLPDDPLESRAIAAGYHHRRIDPDEASAHEAICAMLREGTLSLDDLVTHRATLADIQIGWQAILRKQALKVLVTCNDAPTALNSTQLSEVSV